MDGPAIQPMQKKDCVYDEIRAYIFYKLLFKVKTCFIPLILYSYIKRKTNVSFYSGKDYIKRDESTFTKRE